MFNEYIDRLTMHGRSDFTFQEISQELDISENAAKSGLYRLKKAGKLISPMKGTYVILPPVARKYGKRLLNSTVFRKNEIWHTTC